MFCVGVAPWEGTGVMSKKQMSEILLLAKMIRNFSDAKIRIALFKV